MQSINCITSYSSKLTLDLIEEVDTRYRVAVDIGGTFTDIVLMDNLSGEVRTGKVPSTPQDLSVGILSGVQRLVPDFSEVDFFVHGTTAGLNAFLERKGAHLTLITTAGFRDVYEIGRANRPDMYNLFYRKPTPLVRRRHIYELQEREVRLRATAIHLLHLGHRPGQVAQMLSVKVGSIYNWYRRWRGRTSRPTQKRTSFESR